MPGNSAYLGFPPSPPAFGGPAGIAGGSGIGYGTGSVPANSLFITSWWVGATNIYNVTTGYLWLDGTGGFNVKMVVYDDSGNLVAVSNPETPSGGWQNVAFTFATPISVLNANTEYFVGFITDTGFTGGNVSYPQSSGVPLTTYINQYGGSSAVFTSGISYSSGPPATLGTPSTTYTGVAAIICLQGDYPLIVQGWPEGAPCCSLTPLPNNGYVYASRFKTDSNGLVVGTGYWINASGYVIGPAAAGVMGIYADSGGGSPVPTTLLGQSPPSTAFAGGPPNTQVSIFPFTTPVTLAPNTDYWAALMVNWPTGTVNYCIYSSDSSQSLAGDSTATWPNMNATFVPGASGVHTDAYLPMAFTGQGARGNGFVQVCG